MTSAVAGEPLAATRRGSTFDTVVIGAGAGGLSAAAWLAHGGQRVLVVEREPRVGGRASTIEVDGFRLPTGGVAIELGGPMEQLAREVGASYDVREPSPGVVVRAGGHSINTTSAAMRLLVDGVLLRGARRLTRDWGPDPEVDRLTLADAIGRVTDNRLVHRLARNFAAGVFALNADEVSARTVGTYLSQKGAFRRFGFCPRGSIGIMEGLAEVVTRHSGEVWTGAEIRGVEVQDGRASAVTVDRGDGPERVTCAAVISNAGPAATAKLIAPDALGPRYLRDVADRDRPTPIITVDIASSEPLIDEAGIVFFADTSRLAAIAHLTSTCPEVAPPGQRLYVAYSVPVPALGAFDADAEVAETLAELARELRHFDRARVLRTRVMTGDWPAQRAVAGREGTMQTPLANLINVGDGVRLYGDGGIQACALTGRIAAERILAVSLQQG